ncbi:uncharacterized protein CcaverHIS019_0203110 [Cutaneotrichosporon cavernicola]|uniref:Major facilitator superfamily (MFS) profile domain-containing protein n=1 Tax=Cutaneotrichosporon cavernicola TaxID=279322 RepID=A0AA48I3I4_9TREE|nr:uncharacterized protein CcaverHIS019_0203110 [Cutaneotrichosporon cavernicola]BEI88949.1 hypothetical protein CcaverHIS019_0203110 [Cutaneotrichosporon cavernicola]
MSPNGEREPLINSTAQAYGSEASSLSETPSGHRKERRHHNLAGLPAWRFHAACASVWSATFLSAFDSTVVATLLGDISSGFNAFHLASWLGTAYLLSLACFTPVYGRLADALGRRDAQLVALVFFTAGTAGCAIAPSMMTLILARVIAGIGGAGLTSVGSILLSDLVDLRHRGLYQGLANMVYALGASLGGPVGGWAADQFGWRVAFGAQVPLLFGSIIAIWCFVPGDLGGRVRDADDEHHTLTWQQKLARIDYAGSTALGVAVTALLLSMSLKTSGSGGVEYSWSDPTIWGLLLVFVAFTIFFLIIEAYWATEPVLPLSMFKRATPTAVALGNLVLAMCIFSLLYNVPLYFVAVKLRSATVAGAHLLPYSAFIGAGSLIVGLIMRVTGRYYAPMVVSGLIVLASCGMMLTWGENTPEWLTWVAQSPAGFGYAGVLTTTLVALMADIAKEGTGEIAVGTAMTYMARTIGQVLGVSFSSAILQATLESDLRARISDPDLVQRIRRSTDAVRTLPPGVREIAVSAYSHGLKPIWIFNLVLAAITVIALCRATNEVMPESKPLDDDDEA